MPQYDNIKNEKLRGLVILSESISARDEKDAQHLIDQIAALPEEGQTAMIAALEGEQKAIAEAKAAKGLTPEKEIAEIEANRAKVSAIKRDFEASARNIHERESRAEEAKATEAMLKKIE